MPDSHLSVLGTCPLTLLDSRMLAAAGPVNRADVPAHYPLAAATAGNRARP
jgi:hypothetical protein